MATNYKCSNMGIDYYGISREWSESDIQGIVESLFESSKVFEESVKYIVEDILFDKRIEENLRNESEQSNDTNSIKITSCSVQIALLNELGFFELPKVKEMTSTQKEYVISRLLNRGSRDTKGNINALNPDSNENLVKYTSPTEGTIQKAKKIINEK